MVTETSLAALAELKAGRKLQRMEQRVLDVLSVRNCTREDLTYWTDLRLSSVCGRVRSLLDAGVIAVIDTVKDTETGRKVELLGLVTELKEQV